MRNRNQALNAWLASLGTLLCQAVHAARTQTASSPQPCRSLILRAHAPISLVKRLAVMLALLTAAGSALAEVTVVDPWARTTAPGQQVAAAYLRMMADKPMILVGASSPFADKVELHDVQVDNGVMKMRQVSEMTLEPKQVVELKPGGLHLMLSGIKGAVKVGDNIPLTLIFVDKHNRQENLNIILNGRAPAAYGLPTHGH